MPLLEIGGMTSKLTPALKFANSRPKSSRNLLTPKSGHAKKLTGYIMIVLYHGKDIKKRQKATQKLRQSLETKRPDAEVFSYDSDELTPADLTELAGGRGLFEDKYIGFFYNCLEDHKEAVFDHIEKLADSPHAFVFLEDKIDENDKSKLEKYAKNTKKFADSSREADTKPWDFAEAFGKRNTKTCWLELRRLLNTKDNSAESLHGTLWWQNRLIHLAKVTDSADEANESSYSYKKAASFAKNFGTEELFSNTKQLAEMYHAAHEGEYDLSDRLEEFVLSI
jgi:DNA polymerase III delta subunit